MNDIEKAEWFGNAISVQHAASFYMKDYWWEYENRNPNTKVVEYPKNKNGKAIAEWRMMCLWKCQLSGLNSITHPPYDYDLRTSD